MVDRNILFVSSLFATRYLPATCFAICLIAMKAELSLKAVLSGARGAVLLAVFLSRGQPVFIFQPIHFDGILV